jgi:hypothetical protein
MEADNKKDSYKTGNVERKGAKHGGKSLSS